MASICLYLHAHQPWRIKKYSIFDIGRKHSYFDDQKNKEILKRVAAKSYLPTNKIFLELINKTDGQFKVSFSITGTLLDQLEKYEPSVIESFQQLVATGNVELIAETYYHSLAYLYSKEEFDKQVKLQMQKIKYLFNYRPRVFRNTELMFNNEMAGYVEKQKYQAILAEGVNHYLGWRSPNFIYQPRDTKTIKLLLRNYQLSDDISFRFSNQNWQDWPLTAEKFCHWIDKLDENGEVVNLFMDYETFGEHQWTETGIFEFLKRFPHKALENQSISFKTPSEVIATCQSKDCIDIPHMTAWADTERDLSAWLGNDMQKRALQYIYELENDVLETQNEKIIEDWRKLQTSDHFYYMCTKWFADGDVHKYFNPYESPYECFISYMNILNDLKFRVKPKTKGRTKLIDQTHFVNQYYQIYAK